MEPIQIFKKTGNSAEWEYTVLLGHESDDIGFLVKINQQHWEVLTSGRMAPEHLIKNCFRFLLKKRSKYSIPRVFDLREIEKLFPDFHI